jgi:hypothetical protein
MRFERRVIMFAVLAVVCFVLVPFADESYRNVPLVTGCVYVVLALLFLLDWWSRSRDAKR